MDVLQNIALYEYNSKVEMPERWTKPVMVQRPTAQQARAYADAYENWEKTNNAYVEANAARRRDQERLYVQFQLDLEEEFALHAHPKADLLFKKAWERSSGEGLAQVYHTYADLSELIL